MGVEEAGLFFSPAIAVGTGNAESASTTALHGPQRQSASNAQ